MQGTLLLTVRAPAQLAVEPPAAMSPPVADWLAALLTDPTRSPLWKLSVLTVTGSCCFFSPGQCVAMLEGFDKSTQVGEEERPPLGTPHARHL